MLVKFTNSERQPIVIILRGANMNDIKFGVLPNNEIESREFVYNGRCFADGDMNFKLILEGKYSEISEVYKKKILKFWDLGIKSRIATILYKLKDHYLLYKFKDTIGECENPIDIKQETLPEEIEIAINEIE